MLFLPAGRLYGWRSCRNTAAFAVDGKAVHRQISMAPWPSPGGLSFVVYVDGERVIARVSAAILQQHFGATNPGDATLARAFYAHAAQLQERAVRQYRLRPAQPLELAMDDANQVAKS